MKKIKSQRLSTVDSSGRTTLFIALSFLPLFAFPQDMYMYVSTADDLVYRVRMEDCYHEWVGYLPPETKDICFHPNGKLYAIDGWGKIMEVDTATGTGTVIYTFQFLASQSYNCLTVDARGVFYASGQSGKICTYDPATGAGTFLGNIPLQAAGDITFYNGDLYLAATTNDVIVKIKQAGPGQLTYTYASTQSIPGYLFGLSSYIPACDSVSVFAFADTLSAVYQVNFSTASLSYHCFLSLNITGSASKFEYLGSHPVKIEAVNASGFDCMAAQGVIVVQASGGIGMLSYSLDGQHFQPEGTFVNLEARPYTVYVQDEIGCRIDAEVNLDVNLPAVINATTTRATCGAPNGSVALELTGGTAPFLTWVDGNPTGASLQFTAMIHGPHEIKVTDAAGCSDVATVIVPGVPPPAISMLTVKHTSCGVANGQLTASIEHGQPPFVYILNNDMPQITGEFGDLSPGNYSLTVVDAEGCQVTATAVIEHSFPLVLEEVIIRHAQCAKANGAITLVAVGGVQPLTYTSDGTYYIELPEITGLAEGVYRPAVKDAAGCEVDTLISIDGTVPPAFTHFLTEAATCEDANGALSATYQGGTGPLALLLNSQFQALHFPIKHLSADIYQLILEDSIGCSDTLTVAIPRTNCPIYLPNAFSPNNDGINDRFYPQAINDLSAQVLRFYIFDRWGGFVFKSENRAFSDPNNGWDGQKSGTPLGQGVYAWLLEVVFSDGQSVLKSGDVLLLRE